MVQKKSWGLPSRNDYKSLFLFPPSWYLPIAFSPSAGWAMGLVKAWPWMNSHLEFLFAVMESVGFQHGIQYPEHRVSWSPRMGPAKTNTFGEASAFPLQLPSFIALLETVCCCLGSAPDHLSPWGRIKRRDQVFPDMANQKKNHCIGSEETWGLNLALLPTSCLTLGKFNE